MNQALRKMMAPVLAALAAAACSESIMGNVSLALSSGGGSNPPLAAAAGSLAPAFAPRVVAAGDSTVIALGNDTIVLRSVELVLREVELERVETADCDDSMATDDCEEIERGPMLVSVPLGATATETQVTIAAEPGMFNELEFEIHKPDEVDDAAFIAANPDFADISIRVTGTYSQAGTRSDFTFTSDLNEEQEVILDPPLTIADGSETTVTLRLDVSRWFLNAGGSALVNPVTANKGGANENLVRDNIRASIDAFRDDDHDGQDDDN